MIGQLTSGLITLMLAKFMLNDMPHAVLGNPGMGNPRDFSPGTRAETDKIIQRAGLGYYMPPKFFPAERETEPTRRRKPPLSTRIKNVGSYQVRMELRKDSCSIKLYEFLYGGTTKTRGTWTGMSKPECEAKFNQVVDVINQVRFEEKTQLMRK